MGKFVNPFTDIGFKRIFGQEVSKPLLLDFLNNLLKGKEPLLILHFLIRSNQLIIVMTALSSTIFSV